MGNPKSSKELGDLDRVVADVALEVQHTLAGDGPGFRFRGGVEPARPGAVGRQVIAFGAEVERGPLVPVLPVQRSTSSVGRYDQATCPSTGHFRNSDLTTCGW